MVINAKEGSPSTPRTISYLRQRGNVHTAMPYASGVLRGAPSSSDDADDDDNSTLSNDSLSENSTSTSLDHGARLSNARYSHGKISGPDARPGCEDLDMTEDEVAVMVKNALRKARRAMNNSSPVSDDDGDDDEDKKIGGVNDVFSDDERPLKFRDALDTLAMPSASNEVDLDGTGDGDNASDGSRCGKGGGGDLARRIEEEIQSARAFAEKKYYSASSPSGGGASGGDDDAPSALIQLGRSRGSGRSNHSSLSMDTAETPLVSNLGTAGRAATSGPPRDAAARGIDSPASKGSSPGRSVGSSSSTATPVAANVGGGRTISREPPSARDRMARSKDKVAVATEKLLKKPSAGGGAGATPRVSGSSATPSSSASVAGAAVAGTPTSPNNRTPKQSTSSASAPPPGGMENDAGAANPKALNPKAPGQADFDALLAVSPTPEKMVPISVVTRFLDSTADSASTLNTSMGSERSAGLNNNNDILMLCEQEENKFSGPSSSSHSPASSLSTRQSSPVSANVGVVGGGGASRKPSLSSPLSSPLTSIPNTNNMPPPPPPTPTLTSRGSTARSDAIIISSHSAPEKNINIKWVAPDSDLAALIEAAGEDYNLIRRSNACGALKVLASKDGNKPKLCRTRGMLDVLVKASWDDAVDSDALDARTRAVTTLLYLSEPKDNRLIVARHPRVLEVLVKVVQEDTGEARWRATSALATLAKTPGNRGGMGRVGNLASVLGELMVVGQQRKDDKVKKDNKVQIGDEGAADWGSVKGSGGGKGISGGKGSKGGKGKKSESREEESMSRGPSFDTMDEGDGEDERMLTQTYTGTFTDGTGTTFTEDDLTYQSVYDSDTHSDEDEDGEEADEEGSANSEGEEEGSQDGTQATNDSPLDYDQESIQEEEGVEMQISSLKKLNIENASDFLAKSQLSACATLTHLTRHCANAPAMCGNEGLLRNVIFLAGVFDSPLHTRCTEMLCNFTRFPSNNARLASMPGAVETLLLCGRSKVPEDRMWSIRTIQNLCSDASSKVSLATGAMLSLLSTAAMRRDYEEQYAAVGALLNLSTEPGSIVPLTNTKTVVATLVHLAHSPNTPGAVRKIACDSLATIGLWLQTLASAGTVPEEIPFSPLPTHSATGWLRWDN